MLTVKLLAIPGKRTLMSSVVVLIKMVENVWYANAFGWERGVVAQEMADVDVVDVCRNFDACFKRIMET